MSTRGISFFMTPDEQVRVIQSIVVELRLHSIRAVLKARTRLEVAGPSEEFLMADGSMPSGVFFTAYPPGRILDNPREFHPVKQGLVDLHPCWVRDRTLHMGDLGSKSDWLDPVARKICQNLESHRVFEAMRRRLRRHLVRRAVCFSVRGLGGERICRSVWYSPCVIDWVNAGGNLRQEGIANMAFDIQECDKPKPSLSDAP